ncbi:MAG: hypothetical protein ACE5HT_02615 [Gemmatimonadales bacterium]
MIAYDLKHRRLSVFDTGGRFGRSIALRATEGVRYPLVLGVFTTAGFLVQGSSVSVFKATLGFYRGDAELYRYSLDGRSSSSIGSHPGSDEGFLHIDGDGRRSRAWVVFGRSVQEYNLPDDSRVRWTVFDGHGMLLGTTQFPESFRALDIGEDYVLGVWKDDVDLEHVRLYDLKKP